MRTYSGDKLKLICKNEFCINKSIVFRRFDSTKEQRCKKCDSLLTIVKVINKKEQHQNEIAKRDLRELRL